MSRDQAAFNVLFLCTGNSARSILGEAITNHRAAQLNMNAVGYSAGSTPTGLVNPHALGLLDGRGISTEGLSSKAWNVFAKADAPHMALIVTVCDNAAGEVCPVWPGHPYFVHWGLPDPAAVRGPAVLQEAAFGETAQTLSERIDGLLHVYASTGDRAKAHAHAKRLGAGAGK